MTKSWLDRAWFLAPLLFSIHPILYIWGGNVDEVDPRQVWTTLSINFVLMVLVVSALWAVIKDRKAAAIAVSITLVVVAMIGFMDPQKDLRRGLLVVTLVAPAFWMWRLKKRGFDFGKVLKPLTLVAGVLISMTVFKILTTPKSRPAELQRESRIGMKSRVDPKDLPDILVMIPDSYPSRRVLSELYDFDNGEFIDSLKALGFQMPELSHSNYPTTFLSLGSMFSLDYLDGFGLPQDTMDQTSIHEIIQTAELIQFAKESGYKFVNVSSGWGPTNNMRNATINVPCGSVDEFFVVSIQATLGAYAGGAIRKWFEGDYSSRQECAFSKLSNLESVLGGRLKGKPLFVLSHVVLPHPPYIVDENCHSLKSQIQKYDGGVWDLKEPYVGQVKCANKWMTTAIKKWMETRKRPTVIVIESDHGSAYKERSQLQQPGAVSTSVVKQRFDNFTAIHFVKPIEMPQHLTPINTFRLVVNEVFGTALPLLPNRMFFATYERPFVFKEVTQDILSSTPRRNQ